MSETMCWIHRLRLELHLQLFATLPESLYCVLESYAVLCIPVNTLALEYTDDGQVTNVPRHALD